MHVDEREMLIEKVGVVAADKIGELEAKIEEIHEYLGVIRVAHTKGFKLAKNPALISGLTGYTG